MYLDLKLKIGAFWGSEEGLTVVEYVVAASLLVGVIGLVFLALQTGLSSKLKETISSA